MTTGGDDRSAEEQAALRRVATLVARGSAPEEVFAAVAAEVGRVVAADLVYVGRHDTDGLTLVGLWARTDTTAPVRVGARLAHEGRNVHTVVFRTGRPVRLDDYAQATGDVTAAVRRWGVRSAVGAPIVVDGRPWGVIAAAYTRQHRLPADTEDRLAAFTELVAAAIANAQARTGLRAFANEQGALRRLATLVARGAAAEDVFAAVSSEIGRLLGADYTALSRYDPDGFLTVVGTWSGDGSPPALAVGGRLPLGGRNAATLVFETGRSARVDDLTAATGQIGDRARAVGQHSSIGAPIRVEGRLWGLVTVLTRGQPLPDDAEARLTGFSELVGAAIADAQARTELRGSAEEQAALRRVATLVARAAAPDRVFDAVAGEVGRFLDVEAVSLLRYDPGGTVTLVGRWGVNPVPVGSRVPVGGHNVTTMVLETRRPARIDGYAETASGPLAELALGAGTRSIVGVPITVEGAPWGVLVVGSLTRGLLPADTEARSVGFTELVSAAIANAQARTELRGFAEEQAALRRVATLVARAARPEQVFTAVTEEIAALLDADAATMGRFEPDGTIALVGWTATGAEGAVEARTPPGGRTVTSMVFETGRPARIDHHGDATGAVTGDVGSLGVRSSVGVPIVVAGRVWGVVVVSTTREEALPADTEERLAGFTELVATAIANAQAQVALTASRARIVATDDAVRRRIERNLHDGAQQQLVSLGLRLRALREDAPGDATDLRARLDKVADGVAELLDELREVARGIHPVVLAEGGLVPAVRALARRSAVRVRLDLHLGRRLPEPVELAAYYVVAEALTNAATHAGATAVGVSGSLDGTQLRLTIHDDGRGGAAPVAGSGLIGLTDRVEALGGRLLLHSPPGEGTTLTVALPLGDPAHPPAGGPGGG